MPGSIVSGIMGNKAADAQVNAADKARDVQKRYYEKAEAIAAPWLTSGEAGLKAYESEVLGGPAPSGYAGFRETPGYQFQLDEGQRAINRSLAARGKSLSGDAVKEGLKFSQNLADTTYSNHLQRLQNLAGFGANMVNPLGQLAVTTGQGMADSIYQRGNARASGYAATGKAFSGAIGAVSSFAGGLSGGGGGSVFDKIKGN